MRIMMILALLMLAAGGFMMGYAFGGDWWLLLIGTAFAIAGWNLHIWVNRLLIAESLRRMRAIVDH